jgi:zinc/manganese transport system substrate-binding protein
MAVAGRLGKLDPRHAHDYQDAAANAAADLGRFGGEVESILAAVSPARRLLVTSHDAFRYFADRFGLEVVGTIIPGRSTDVAPSAARLAELAQEMRTRGICVVFANVEDSSALAESLADEVGSDVVVVSLFAATLPNGHEDLGGYERLVRENASRVAKALARCA